MFLNCELRNLFSRLETENSVTFQGLEKTFCREVKEKTLVCSLVSWLLKH